MVRYDVAFDVNGTVHTINIKSVKVGNRYLQCMDDTATNDSEVVAMLPFDSIEYIVYESMTISSDAVGGETLTSGVPLADDPAAAGDES